MNDIEPNLKAAESARVLRAVKDLQREESGWLQIIVPRLEKDIESAKEKILSGDLSWDEYRLRCAELKRMKNLLALPDDMERANK